MRALFFIVVFLLAACAHQDLSHQEEVAPESETVSEVDYRWSNEDYVEYHGPHERRDYHFGKLERVMRYDPHGRVLSVEEITSEPLPESYTGPRRTYFANGKLRREIGFINGRREGVEKILFADKKVRESSEWKLDRREGPYREFYENGKPRILANYEQGAIDGLVKTFAESGMMIQEASFASGLKEGLEQTYFPNGYFRSRTQFHNGRRHGGAESYTPDGHLLWRGHYRDGELDGDLVCYFSDGVTPSEKFVFQKGRRVEEKYLSEDGGFINLAGDFTLHRYRPACKAVELN